MSFDELTAMTEWARQAGFALVPHIPALRLATRVRIGRKEYEVRSILREPDRDAVVVNLLPVVPPPVEEPCTCGMGGAHRLYSPGCRKRIRWDLDGVGADPTWYDPPSYAAMPKCVSCEKPCDKITAGYRDNTPTNLFKCSTCGLIHERDGTLSTRGLD